MIFSRRSRVPSLRPTNSTRKECPPGSPSTFVTAPGNTSGLGQRGLRYSSTTPYSPMAAPSPDTHSILCGLSLMGLVGGCGGGGGGGGPAGPGGGGAGGAARDI